MDDTEVCPRCLKLEKTIRELQSKVSKKNQLIKLHKEISECIEVKKLKYSSDEVGAIYKSAVKDAQVLRDRLNFYVNENSELSKLTEDLRCRISHLENKCKDGENKLNHIVFINKQLLDSHSSSEQEVLRLKKKIKTLTKFSSGSKSKNSEAKGSLGLEKLKKSRTEKAPVEDNKSINSDITETESNLDQDTEYKSDDDSFSDCSFTDAESTATQDKGISKDRKSTEDVPCDSSLKESTLLGENNLHDEVSLKKSVSSANSSFLHTEKNSKGISEIEENQKRPSVDLQHSLNEKVISPDCSESKYTNLNKRSPCSVGLDLNTTKKENYPASKTTSYEDNISIFDLSSDNSDPLSKNILKNIQSSSPCKNSKNSSADIISTVNVNSSHATVDLHNINSSKNHSFTNEMLSYPKNNRSVCTKVDSSSSPKVFSESDLTKINVNSLNETETTSFNLDTDSQQSLDSNMDQEKDHHAFDSDDGDECISHNLMTRSPDNSQRLAVSKKAPKTRVHEEYVGEEQDHLDYNKSFTLNASLTQCPELLSPLKSAKHTPEKKEECDQNKDVQEENSSIQISDNIVASKQDAEISPTFDANVLNESNTSVNNQKNETTDLNNVKNENSSSLQYNGVVTAKGNGSGKEKIKDQNDDLLFGRKPHVSLESNTFSPQYHFCNQTCVYECYNCKDTLYNDRANFVWSFKDNSSVQISVPVKKGNEKIGIEINDVNNSTEFSAETNGEKPVASKYSIVVNLKPEKVTSDFNCDCPSSRIENRKFVKLNDCRSCEPSKLEKEDITDNDEMIDKNVKWHKWRKMQELTEYPVKENRPFARDSNSKKNTWSFLSPMVFPRIIAHVDTDVLRTAFQSLSLDHSTFFANLKQHNSATFSLENKPKFYNPLNHKNSESASMLFGQPSSEVLGRNQSNFCLKASLLNQGNKKNSHYGNTLQKTRSLLSSCSKEVNTKSLEATVPPKEIIPGNEQRKLFKTTLLNFKCSNMNKPLSQPLSKKKEPTVFSAGIFQMGLNSANAEALIKSFPSEKHMSSVRPIIRAQTFQVDSSKQSGYAGIKFKNSSFEFQKSTPSSELFSKESPTEEKNLINNLAENVPCCKDPTTFSNISDFAKSQPETTPIQASTNISDEVDSRSVIESPKLPMTCTESSPHKKIISESSEPLVTGKGLNKVNKKLVNQDKKLSKKEKGLLNKGSVQIEKCAITENDSRVNNNGGNKQLCSTKSVLESSPHKRKIKSNNFEQSDNPTKHLPLEIPKKSYKNVPQISQCENGQNISKENLDTHVSMNDSKQADAKHSTACSPLKKEMASHSNNQNKNVLEDSTKTTTNSTSEVTKSSTWINGEEAGLKEISTKGESQNVRSPPISYSEIDNFPFKRRRIAHISNDNNSLSTLPKKDINSTARTGSKSPEKEITNELAVTKSSEELESTNKNKVDNLIIKSEEKVSLKSAFKVPKDKVLKRRLPGFRNKNILSNDGVILENIFKSFHCIAPLSPLSKSPVFFNDEDCEDIDNDNDEEIHRKEVASNNVCDLLLCDRTADQHVIEEAKIKQENNISNKFELDIDTKVEKNDEEHVDNVQSELNTVINNSGDDNVLNFEAAKDVNMIEDKHEKTMQDKTCKDYSDSVTEPDEDSKAGEKVNFLKCKAVSDSKQDLPISKSEIIGQPMTDSSKSIIDSDEESNLTEICNSKEKIIKTNADLSHKSCILVDVCKNLDSSSQSDKFLEEKAVQNLDSSKQPDDIGIIKMEIKIEEDINIKNSKNDKTGDHNNEISQNCSDVAFNVFVERYRSGSLKVNALTNFSYSKKRSLLKKTKDFNSKEVSILPNHNKSVKLPFIGEIERKEEITENQLSTRGNLLISNTEKELNHNVTTSKRVSEVCKSELCSKPLEIVSDVINSVNKEKAENMLNFKALQNGSETRCEKRDSLMDRENIFKKKKYLIFSDDEEDIDTTNIDSNPKLEHNEVTSIESQCNDLTESIYSRDTNFKLSPYKRKAAEKKVYINPTSSNKNLNHVLNNSNPKDVGLLTLKNNPGDISVKDTSSTSLISNTPTKKNDKLQKKHINDRCISALSSLPQAHEKSVVSPSSLYMNRTRKCSTINSSSLNDNEIKPVWNAISDITEISDSKKMPELGITSPNESFGFRGFYTDTTETLSSDLQYEESKFKKEDVSYRQGNEVQNDSIDLSSPIKKETDLSLPIKKRTDISIEEKEESITVINCKKRSNVDLPENLEFTCKKIKLDEEVNNSTFESSDSIECKENLFICAIKYFASEVLTNGWEKDQKPNISKKDISDIKYQIMRLAGASEDNLYQHVNNVVQPLIDSPIMQPRPLAKAIIEILCEDNGKELDQYPKMTKATKLCLLFTISFIGYNKAFLMETLKVLEENICAYYDKTLTVPNGIKLITYYAALCRSYNLENKGKQLLYDVLYARHIKAYPMIYKCLQIWPTILPKAEKCLAEGCLLTQTIAFILIAAKKTAVSEKLQSLYRINNLRMYLNNSFGYDSDFKRRDDLSDELVKRISEKGSRLALVLLAQCEGYDWAITLVEKKLFPLIQAWLQDKLDNTTVQAVILSIGMIVRAFPLSKSAYFVKNTLELLEKILHRSPDKKFAETVIEAVSLIRRHNLMLCVLILIKWIPKSKTVTKKTLIHVRNILSVKNITHWRSFYIKHHAFKDTDSLPL